MSDPQPLSTPAPARPLRRGVVLVVCCMSLFLVTMDVTIVNVALPVIGRDLHAPLDGLQWCVDAYTLVVASFLMLSGATADRVGRRRVFQSGLVLFTLGSFLCSLATSNLALVLCRVLQACGGSMLNPVAMSIIANTYLDARERARAIGLWGATTGVSLATGPVLGGVLTQSVGWRAVFWVNVPVGLLALLLTARFVPESRAARARRPDPVAQLLVVLGLAALTATLIEAPRLGWHSAPIGAGFMLAAAAIFGLIAHERRRSEPLIDLRFFRSIPLSAATLVAVLTFTAYSGSLFLLTLHLQEVRGLAPSTAGLCLLPSALALLVCSPLSGRWVAAGHTRAVLVSAGIAIAASGALMLGLDAHTPLARVLLALGLFGIGMGLVNAPITNTAVSGMPRAQAGLAAGLTATSRQVGATLGVALIGALAGRPPGVGRLMAGAHVAGAQHATWWLVIGCGLTIAAIGLAVTGARARRSVERVAALIEEPAARAAIHTPRS